MTSNQQAARECPFCGKFPRIVPPSCKQSDPYRPGDHAFPLVRCCHVDVHGDDWDESCTSAVTNWNRRDMAREWLPIESAPEVKGEYFWCLIAWGPEDDMTTGEGFRWQGRWFAAGSFHRPGQERRFEWREIEVKPTHWMHKPSTPPRPTQERPGEDRES